MRKREDAARKLNSLFEPRSLVFLGASRDPRKIGFNVLNNIIRGGFPGKIYPVNPREEEIQGLRVYRNVTEVPETPDLAIVVVPPQSVVAAVKECVKKGVKAGVVITAGFAELGEEGKSLQNAMVAAAREGGMVLVGPNCNGIMNPWQRLHIQFPPFLPPAGPISVVAQSGNIVDSMARQIMLRGVGVSKCISSGNEADLHMEDYLEYLAEDPQTKVILSYVEGFKDGERFFRIARKVSRKKPVVMLKGGITSAGATAVMSHTASIAGSDGVIEGVCRQSGVIRAQSLDDMLNIGIALLRQPLPKGRRIGIVTGGGGWGVLAADACAALGFEVVPLPPETIAELDGILPAWWNRGNPVDLVAGTWGDDVFRAVELLLKCSTVDSVLMMSIMTVVRLESLPLSADAAARKRWEDQCIRGVCEALNRFNELAARYGKPVIVASEQMFASAALETEIVHALGRDNSVCYQMPHQAAAVLAGLTDYAKYTGRW